MQRITFFILFSLTVALTSCYKDKGNYTYHVPAAPVVANLDTVYEATVGDSLFVKPDITFSGKDKLGYEWRVDVPEQLKSFYFYGPELRMLFSFSAQRYSARLAIIDSSNQMEYVFPFKIQGNTIYSNGILVLSNESGTSQLSFVKPDSTVQPRVYAAINQHDLPANGQQIIGLYNQFLAGGYLFNYWILSSSGDNPGVEIDPNTLTDVRTLRDNFFSPPATIAPGYFVNNPGNGAMIGVLNNQMWAGAYQTSPYSAIYNNFSLPASGNYRLYKKAVINNDQGYYLGYDLDKKQVAAFMNYGTPTYVGTSYQDTTKKPFDPANMGLDPLEFEQINDQNCYVIGTNADDSVYVMGFATDYTNGLLTLTPLYNQPFPRQDLVTASTVWAASYRERFYMNNGSTIYEYNPKNQAITPLTTTFNGTVSMLKVSPDGGTLYVGVEGSLYFLDVSVGKTGNILRKIDGIPGAPVDIYLRGNY